MTKKKLATWEHIDNDMPLNDILNCARCCSSCNSSKGTKKLSDWLKSPYCKKKNINIETVAKIIKQNIKD